jgi:hypothetical protein
MAINLAPALIYYSKEGFLKCHHCKESMPAVGPHESGSAELDELRRLADIGMVILWQMRHSQPHEVEPNRILPVQG